MIDFIWSRQSEFEIGSGRPLNVAWVREAIEAESSPCAQAKELKKKGWATVCIRVHDRDATDEICQEIYVSCASRKIYPVMVAGSRASVWSRRGFMVEIAPRDREDYAKQITNLWGAIGIFDLDRFLQLVDHIPIAAED